MITRKNAYLIRVKGSENYLHPYKETGKTIQYRVTPGTIGAAVWDKKTAKAFIAAGTKEEQRILEMVLLEQAAPTQQNLMEQITSYIEKLENQSFEGWTEEEIRGYKTACTSIKVQTILLSKGHKMIDLDKINNDPNIN